MSCLSLLRERTRAAHQDLDRRLVIGRSEVTRETYSLYLGVMLEVSSEVEETLATLPGWAGALPDQDKRVKSPALRGDLSDLDEPPRSGTVESPVIGSIATGMGVAYVLEGSTLGGVVLARHVRSVLGADVPLRYLEVYGDALGPMWKAFCASLDRFVDADAGAADAVCDAALATFATLARSFDRQGLLL